MTLEEVLKSNWYTNHHQWSNNRTSQSAQMKSSRRIKNGAGNQAAPLNATNSIEEISIDSCYPDVVSEQVPLNTADPDPSTLDELPDEVTRKIRTAACFCTVEPNQKGKASLYIDGYEQMPNVSLEDAVASLLHLIPDINEKLRIAKQNVGSPVQRKLKRRGLSSDESTAIRLYTMQWAENKESLYWLLNKNLREGDQREQMEPWLGYLKLFLSALIKLPSEKRTVWRGVKEDLSENYTRGNTITWWCVSSCTESIRLLQQEQFLGQSGKRTLFSIECCRGKMVKDCSDYPKELEVLLLPGTQLMVIEKAAPAPDLHIIHLQEIIPKKPYLTIPLSQQEIKNERVNRRRKVNQLRAEVLIEISSSGNLSISTSLQEAQLRKPCCDWKIDTSRFIASCKVLASRDVQFLTDTLQIWRGNILLLCELFLSKLCLLSYESRALSENHVDNNISA